MIDMNSQPAPSLVGANFVGRRILLIISGFFGYDQEIISRLKLRGAIVTTYSDRPTATNFGKFLNRLSPRLVRGAAKRHLQRILDECSEKIFDEILIVKGEGFSPAALHVLFARFPEARTTFYMWDSFRNARGSRERMACFERSFSFDPVDAGMTPGLKLRPLFFVPSYTNVSQTSTSLDLLFVGTVHTDRYRVLSRLAKNLPAGVNHYFFLYFPARFIYRVRRWISPQLWGSQPSEFSFKPLSHAENSALYVRARAIVDIERAVQTGLTMRTFEVLAARKKLITTNRSIKNSDLFDPANVLIIDRINPRVPLEFLQTPFCPVDSAVLARYSLDFWLDEVVG